MTAHPYHNLAGSEPWGTIDRAIAELERNGDLSLTTGRSHVVGYLCRAILEAGIPGGTTSTSESDVGNEGSATSLADYIRSHPEFSIVASVDGNYGHMGATLTDAVLQAGVKYETVVRPRVQRLLANYPDANTTSGFARLLADAGPERLLAWKGGRKLVTLTELIQLLVREGVETEDDFRAWINLPGNLDRLRQIKGIKEKTANYIQILLGEQSVAVDRHLFRFLAEAGFPTSDYSAASEMIRRAAGELDVHASVLDHSIWRYMSERVPSA